MLVATHGRFGVLPADTAAPRRMAPCVRCVREGQTGHAAVGAAAAVFLPFISIPLGALAGLGYVAWRKAEDADQEDKS